ncbi:MAG: hypothetical protein JMN27_17635 [gamma proteobacterium endosymbiont of Lamellibrachia anaximandri]|nr:hypothetical protein [gamma proteobacterium endosymbiont of Lamellibrachia anaximandri]MBL3535630.1 hypothetical protein [gamma proteobacterium endosymbiont of Lamellibrachia anaximandri]
MKVQDEHMYHGAALAQIAENPQFTAINALKVGGKNSKSTYKVNDSIAVYLKYASKPIGTYKEYNFTFTTSHLSEMKRIVSTDHMLYIALVCIKGREVCCISYEDLINMIDKRKEAHGGKESQYTILCTLKPKQAFRVNMNQPGKKKTYLLTKSLVVKRNTFPSVLFN